VISSRISKLGGNPRSRISYRFALHSQASSKPMRVSHYELSALGCVLFAARTTKVCVQISTNLLDHLVSAYQDGLRDCDPDRLRGL
jgi:hypothetical protein